MIIIEKRIPYTYGQTIKLMPIFDIHMGNRACDKKALSRDLAAADPDTFFTGGGDWMDSVIVSDSKRYRKSSDDSDPAEDDIVDQQIDEVYSYIEPYKDRLIGVGDGNHEDNITIRCGTNPSKRLATMLGVPFLSYSYLIKLVLEEKKSRVRTIIIRGHHGWGGGSRTAGGSITKYARDASCWDADIFLYGHDHRKQSDKVPRLGLSGMEFISRPKIMVLCGTYLKTYIIGESPTYSEKSGYPPTPIGASTISIKPSSRWAKISVEE